jgi:hypothetical protein
MAEAGIEPARRQLRTSGEVSVSEWPTLVSPFRDLQAMMRHT